MSKIKIIKLAGNPKKPAPAKRRTQTKAKARGRFIVLAVPRRGTERYWSGKGYALDKDKAARFLTKAAARAAMMRSRDEAPHGWLALIVIPA